MFGYSIEAPQVPQHMFSWRNQKKSLSTFWLKKKNNKKNNKKHLIWSYEYKLKLQIISLAYCFANCFGTYIVTKLNNALIVVFCFGCN